MPARSVLPHALPTACGAVGRKAFWLPSRLDYPSRRLFRALGVFSRGSFDCRRRCSATRRKSLSLTLWTNAASGSSVCGMSVLMQVCGGGSDATSVLSRFHRRRSRRLSRQDRTRRNELHSCCDDRATGSLASPARRLRAREGRSTSSRRGRFDFTKRRRLRAPSRQHVLGGDVRRRIGGDDDRIRVQLAEPAQMRRDFVISGAAF